MNKNKITQTLFEGEVELSTLLDSLKERNVISLETTLKRILLTGSNGHVASIDCADQVYSDLAFNGYEEQIKQRGRGITSFVVSQSYSFTKETKANRLFILAKVAGNTDDFEASSYALNTAVDLCMDAEDILRFACFISYYRGFGRMVKKVLSRWYLERDPRDLLGEVLAHKKVTVQFDEKPISFSHRSLVRRLFLRGSDDLQDACLRIIKGYRGDASEVPQRFLTYSEVLGLNLCAKGSVETAAKMIEGLPFDHTVYPKKFLYYAEILSALFYGKHVAPENFLQIAKIDPSFEFLDDKLADRFMCIVSGWLRDQRITPVDLLIYREALDAERFPETRRLLLRRYEEVEYPERGIENNAVFLFLNWDEISKEVVAGALDRAKSLHCNLVIVGEGTFVLDPKNVTVDALYDHLRVVPKDRVVMPSMSFIQILMTQPVAYDNVVIYEHRPVVKSEHFRKGFLDALDTYLTGRNPLTKIVHHVAVEDATVILDEPRHAGLLTVKGIGTLQTKLVDIFLAK
ncbi:TROVE containing domain protein [Vibrio phage vB_pir03]|nr:TROVE containing domain protein [Vibrio phage vB_pir03]